MGGRPFALKHDQVDGPKSRIDVIDGKQSGKSKVSTANLRHSMAAKQLTLSQFVGELNQTQADFVKKLPLRAIVMRCR
jgi:hypothetical protein